MKAKEQRWYLWLELHEPVDLAAEVRDRATLGRDSVQQRQYDGQEHPQRLPISIRNRFFFPWQRDIAFKPLNHLQTASGSPSMAVTRRCSRTDQQVTNCSCILSRTYWSPFATMLSTWYVHAGISQQRHTRHQRLLAHFVDADDIETYTSNLPKSIAA